MHRWLNVLHLKGRIKGDKFTKEMCVCVNNFHILKVDKVK